MAFLQFNAQSVVPQQTFDPIPAGTYNATITESEVVNTKTGSGQMLKLTWRINEGPFANRLVFDRINIVNQNPKAEEIGQRQLSSLCHVAGVLQLQDTQQLHGIPIGIKVSIRHDATGQYSDSNDVKGYLAANGGGQRSAGIVTSQPQPAVQPAQAATPPWKTRAA
jgi:hypothetical protein